MTPLRSQHDWDLTACQLTICQAAVCQAAVCQWEPISDSSQSAESRTIYPPSRLCSLRLHIETAHFLYLNGRQRPDTVDVLLSAQYDCKEKRPSLPGGGQYAISRDQSDLQGADHSTQIHPRTPQNIGRGLSTGRVAWRGIGAQAFSKAKRTGASVSVC